MSMLLAAALSYCAYVGDSIAIGLEARDPECDLIADNYKLDPAIPYHYVIISDVDNIEKAIRVREHINGAYVIWILPYDRTTAQQIINVADTYEDGYIDLTRFPTRDAVHPDYKAVSEEIGEHLTSAFD